MTERDIAAEVLRGLQEVREHRTGKRTLREARIDPTPIRELDPGMVARIRESLEGSESCVAGEYSKNKLLCAAPDDGLTMLHYLSPLVAVEPSRARAWVYKQCHFYRENHERKLERRYRRLLKYSEMMDDESVGTSGRGL